MKEVDLQCCSRDEVVFSSRFHLKVKKKDYLDALATYFEVLFTMGHERIKFSTGPEAR